TTFGEYVESIEGDPMGKEFTLNFTDQYADWEILVDGTLPAHVMAEESGMSMEDMVQAAQDKDAAALAPVAKFWNEGWDFTPGNLPDESLIPSSGQYKLKQGGWNAGQYITLEANENYVGAKPLTKELVIRFAAADTHTQALDNEELDVIEPQATVDTLEQLRGYGDSVIIQTGDQLTWEHLDFNWQDGSAFAGEDSRVREAFALCLPRQDIVDRLIKPINEDAVVMNARQIFPFQDGYQDVVDYAYPTDMDEPNVERAKQLLEEADAVGTTVRVGYNAPNPRRSETVSLIQASCNEAGFDIQNNGDANFFSEVLPAGDYDVALFAWAGSGQKASDRNIYHTNGQQNQGKYSNAQVDAEWDALATELDESAQREHVKEIEKLLWEDFHAIPLYAHPGVLAQRAEVANVRDTATQTGALWNVEQWVKVQ
ncbi:MAG: ABC transporter substrate-binding protein, partial [Micrococcus sp.]|nr:ABC transporter substrate-binding protein [Micrococcus sp.]